MCVNFDHLLQWSFLSWWTNLNFDHRFIWRDQFCQCSTIWRLHNMTKIHETKKFCLMLTITVLNVGDWTFGNAPGGLSQTRKHLLTCLQGPGIGEQECPKDNWRLPGHAMNEGAHLRCGWMWRMVTRKHELDGQDLRWMELTFGWQKVAMGHAEAQAWRPRPAMNPSTRRILGTECNPNEGHQDLRR